MKKKTILFALVVLMSSSMAGAGEGGANRMFWGGGFGASFGTIDYVELSPMVGFYPVDRLATGLRLTYRHRSDGRYSPSLSTNDYGGGLFARYHFTPRFFGHGEYEYLTYEYYRLNGAKDRDNYNSLLGGGGFSQPMGENVSFFASVLYNFLYDSNELYRPYDSPWVFRLGVGARF